MIQKSLFMLKGKCFSLCVKVSGAPFFNLLASQGPCTKLATKNRPERILPVYNHILQMIVGHT